MNRYINAIRSLDFDSLKDLLAKKPGWIQWQEEDGKNGLHFLCGVPVTDNLKNQKLSLEMLKFLLKKGMNMNSIHKIAGPDCIFPATPLWYAYAKGRNEKIYSFLLAQDADPENCMFAIAWNDDIKAAALFKKYSAKIEKGDGKDTPFPAAFMWKRFKVAEWFLRNGANPNARDHKGNAALFYAVKRKYDLEKIELLLKNRADMHLKNVEGISPGAIAESNRQKNILKVFAKYDQST
ncbi:MAG: ankyrin repeat domain-containing protein [Chitinophagales bacterium]